MDDAGQEKRTLNTGDRSRIEQEVRAEIVDDTTALLAESRQLRKRLAELRREVAAATEEARRLRTRR
jgi:cell division septum initiation protein DivIVA